MDCIYHITTRPAWEEALRSGAYTADTLATEGFIHCSTNRQIEATVNRYFKGRDDLILLAIDARKVQNVLRYEPAHGELYPHVYGPFPSNAVLAVHILTPSIDGSFTLDRSLIAL